MTIERLRNVLNAIGPPVTTIQLAEMIWLADQLTVGYQEAERVSDAADTRMTEPVVEAEPQSASRGEFPPHAAGPATAQEKLQALHAPGASAAGNTGTDAEALLVPTAPILRHPLAVQRALRPLKRRIPSRLHWALDEAATAARAADRSRTHPWIPVMVPARERWLSLALIIDTGSVMDVWRPLASELREAMFRLGAFRDVRVWLLADLADRVGIRASLRSPVMAPATLIDPTGRQAVLVFSDCSGPHWWEGRAAPAVHLWARHGPTAILQPLTERLWRRTAAPIVPGQAALARPGAPNTALRFTPHVSAPRQRAGSLPVPVIELSADWLADWARLVAASGRGGRDTALAYLTDRVLAADEPLIAEREMPIADRVLRFRAAASAEAAELAAHVAVAVPYLPVMQLIQQRIMPSSRPGDLAEVLLSGLLFPIEAVPGLYDFIPGARAALLQMLPRPESLATAEVLEQISAEIQARAGTVAKTFQAVMPVAEGTGSLPLSPDERPFALVSSEALSILNHTAIPVFDSAPTDLPVRSPKVRTEKHDPVVGGLTPPAPSSGASRKGRFYQDGATGSGAGFWKLLSSTEQAALSDRGRTTVFPPGTVMYVEGDPSTHVFVILAGWVKVLSITSEGYEMVLALRGDGDIIGEVAGETTGYREATVRAIDTVRTLVVGYDRFSAFLDAHPVAAHAYRRVMTQRWQETNTRLRSHLVTSGAQRLAGVVLELATLHGNVVGGDIDVAMPLSQEELASLAGTSRTTVVRALSKWRQRGIIRTSRRGITIINLQSLQRIAGQQA